MVITTWYKGYVLVILCMVRGLWVIFNMSGAHLSLCNLHDQCDWRNREREREREGKRMVFGRIFLHANVAIELKDEYKFPNRIVRL